MIQETTTTTEEEPRLFFSSIEDNPDYFDLACSSCSFIKVTFACSGCKTRQCADCIKTTHNVTLSAKEVSLIPPQKFKCIGCFADKDLEDTDFSPAGIAAILDSIYSRKNDLLLTLQEKKHQEEIVKLQNQFASSTDCNAVEYKSQVLYKKFERLTTMYRPCCALAFVDFDACAALHCDFCHKNFCALCLDFVTEGVKKTHDELIDDDVNLHPSASLHHHVKNCKFNIHFKNDYFVPQWYPQYAQYSRFCFQWNISSGEESFEVLQNVFQKLLPLIKDTNIAFDENTGLCQPFIKDIQIADITSKKQNNNNIIVNEDDRGIRRQRQHHHRRHRHRVAAIVAAPNPRPLPPAAAAIPPVPPLDDAIPFPPAVAIPPPPLVAIPQPPEEEVFRRRRRIMCSFCNELGFHNRQTCPKRRAIPLRDL
jgi:hypothetical protein